MNRFIPTLILLVISCVMAFAWPTSSDIIVPTGAKLQYNNGSGTWMPEGVATGYVTPATRTISIPANTAVNLGALIPSGCQGYRFRAFGGDIVTNSRAGLATGSFPCGDITASGAVYGWDGPATNGDIWAAERYGNAATLTAWGF